MRCNMGARASDKPIQDLKISGTQKENKMRLLPVSSNISRLKYERNTGLIYVSSGEKFNVK